MLFEKWTCLLIEHNQKTKWWRTTVGLEGMTIGIWLIMWANLFFAFGALCYSGRDVFSAIMDFWIIIAVISVVVAAVLQIKQKKGRIQDVPMLVSDRTLKVLLAVYILFPIVCGLCGFLMLLTHYLWGWFAFMD